MKIRFPKLFPLEPEVRNRFSIEVDGTVYGGLEFYPKTKTHSETTSEIWIDDIDVFMPNMKGWTRKGLNDFVRKHFEYRKLYPNYMVRPKLDLGMLDDNGVQYQLWGNSVLFFKTQADYAIAQLLI